MGNPLCRHGLFQFDKIPTHFSYVRYSDVVFSFALLKIFVNEKRLCHGIPVAFYMQLNKI